MLMEVLEAAGVSLASSKDKRQSETLFWAPDVHSKVMLYVASSRDHLLTLSFAFLPFRKFCMALLSLHTAMSDPCR